MFCPKLAIFDLDGTLIEPWNDYLFDQAEFILPTLGYARVVRADIENHFKDFDFFRFVPEAEREEVSDAFWQAFDWERFPKPVALSGVVDVLKNLRNLGMSVAVATARTMAVEQLEADLAPTGLLDYIQLIKTRPGDHVHWSDKRESIKFVCETLGVLPQDSMMVGDTPSDIISAYDVGIGFTVAVQTGELRDSILRQAKPHAVLPSVSDLMTVVRFD